MRGFLPTGDSHRVTSLELLFDLVFVYAVTAVSESVTERLTAAGLVEGIVLMGLMWFGWSAYAWLGNQARADEGPLRVSLYLATTGYFVAALTIHEAFGEVTTGLRGPLVFVVAYAVIRLAHLLVYRAAAGDDHGLVLTIRRSLISTSVVLVLLLAGSFAPPTPRLAIWAAAVLLDYVAVYLGARGWRVAAPGHFAERHSGVVIIAIGESVVSVAIGVSGADLNWPLLAGALLGIVLAITLWRTYFSAIAVAAERSLHRLDGEDRTWLARDTFTYLHPLLVIGIVGMAVGLRVTLGQVAERGIGSSTALPAASMVALFGGAALYLVTLAMLRWRLGSRPSLPRMIVAGWLVVAGVALGMGPGLPLLDVAVVTASFLGLVTFDALRYGRITREMRLAGDG